MISLTFCTLRMVFRTHSWIRAVQEDNMEGQKQNKTKNIMGNNHLLDVAGIQASEAVRVGGGEGEMVGDGSVRR